MCNLYDIGSPRGTENTLQWNRWQQQIAETVDALPKVYNLSRTDCGVVVRLVDGETKAGIARWGCVRSKDAAVNNARGDKLRTVWQQQWQHGRCVIPVSTFYEWNGPKRDRQTHAIQLNNKSPMWMAGVSQLHSELGLCFATVTTTPNNAMAPIHSRMPVILSDADVEFYLKEDDPMDLIQPYSGELKITKCQNPRKKGYVPGPPQQMSEEQLDLFE